MRGSPLPLVSPVYVPGPTCSSHAEGIGFGNRGRLGSTGAKPLDADMHRELMVMRSPVSVLYTAEMSPGGCGVGAIRGVLRGTNTSTGAALRPEAASKPTLLAGVLL